MDNVFNQQGSCTEIDRGKEKREREIIVNMLFRHLEILWEMCTNGSFRNSFL